MQTLDQIPTERKHNTGSLSESWNDSASDGSILIRIGPGGSCSVQVHADSSTEEEKLRELLTAAWPALEWMQRSVQAGSAAAVEEGG